MALQKNPVNINFAAGLDTKTDKNQVPIGKFLALQNSVFNKVGQLTKRNGFPTITTLPNAEQTTLTTLGDNLLATGSNLYAFSKDTDQWLNRGPVQPVNLNVIPLVRSSTGQTSPDTAVTSSGLTCLAYMDSGESYYQVSDSSTGQQIVSRQALPTGAVNPRVFLLNRYFIVSFVVLIAATPHLQYIAIPISIPTSPGVATDISASVSALQAGYDAVVANNTIYFAWAGAANTVKLAYMSSTLVVSAVTTLTTQTATLMSVSADISGSTPTIWATWYDSVSTNASTAAFSSTLAPILAATPVITGEVLATITSIATAGVMSLYYEILNNYDDVAPNPNTSRTDYIKKNSVTIAGVVGTASIIARSVGLASKPFVETATNTTYLIVAYGETNQPTYFLMDTLGNIYMRLAYSNGGGYMATQVLPSVSSLNGVWCVPYQIKDFLASVNKNTNLPSGTPTNGIYTQTGINLAMFSINTNGQYSSEIAGALHLTGGQLWEYDGVRPVEHGFQVWPENVTVTTATGSGSLSAQEYYYAFTYEWTDNQGNLHRSAPSIPTAITTTTASSTNTIYVPTLRLTYKVSPNPVRIVGYRWSVAQQTYYQFTSITSPIVNDPTVDYVTITDAQADSAILGNVLLYTTGGVVENIAAPASIASALFKNRLFLVDAEDRNLIWYSKQVIEATPVEMSDLFTLYVAPTSGAQGSTGPITALSSMDDKLIIFKKDAIYYLTGTGPDNTGSQNDFNDPIYITSSVGCTNPSSIVLMPMGIMFQSNKGIWLLGRDLSTQYIGSAVEQYNDQPILSARAIPATNEVRFVLGNNVTLMYDYFMQQWGTFSNIYAISSTLYQGADTYLNTYGTVFQESPGTYLDGSQPVLMSFTTSWINIAGLQGYERFYEMYLLGTYITPFKLNVAMSYDYAIGAPQTAPVSPDNFSPAWGGEASWGSGSVWGGPSNVFEARVFPERQKCESFQISITEIYDPSFGVAAGAGLTLSGLNLVVGVKKGYRVNKASQSFG